MITQANEQAGLLPTQSEDEKAEEVRKATADATATRLKTTFNEVRKSGATENPEAGCVPWYHFPQADTEASMAAELKDPGARANQQFGSLKHRLVSRRCELVDRVHAVAQDLERTNDPASAQWSERAAQRSNDEVLEAIGDADARELASIDAALRRLELGTYGACTRCGRVIAAERLRVLPHIGYCEKCALVSDAQHRASR